MRWLLLISLLILTGCSRSALLTQAEAEFRRRNPGVEPLKVYLGEGDADHAYVVVRYKHTPTAHPQRETVKELEMGYRRSGETWTLFHEKSK